MKKAILLFLICSNYLHSQTQSESNTIYSDTPGRIFDTLLDRDNNKYPINNLRIIGSGGSISSAPSLSCNAGYFTLYFVNPATNPTMMNVACQLFTDISCLITSPLSSACHNTTNTATRVNIKVDVITFTNSVLGNAGGYFAVPLNPTSTSPGITDNMIYKTITSGVDTYLGIAPPFVQMNTFYHGEINISANANWNFITSSTSVPSSAIDFYTVFLHEAMHALGFASLFSPTGTSAFGSNNNYYSRYDSFLCDNNNIPLLNSPTLCPSTSMSFTGSIVNSINTGSCILTSGSLSTPCNSAVKYISPSNSYTVPVYTPTCWVNGSSLSHFEDACYPANGPYGASNYFVMSSAYNPGNQKRFPQEEERKVLCDIGYSVNSSYNSPVAGTSKNYSLGACSSSGVWGQNDGLAGGTYSYIMTGTSLTIPKSTLLMNDSPNSVTVTCEGIVYNDPQLNFSSNNTNITVSLAPGPSTVSGVFLIQYIPRDAAGNQGNITYCYFYVPGIGQCSPPDLCHIVQNGGFESGISGCGIGAVHSSGFTSCWDDFTFHGGGVGADVYARNCTNNFLNIGSTFMTTTYGITDTYNGVPNNRIIRMVGGGNPSNPNMPVQSEVIRNRMSAALTPSANYVLDFWVFNRTVFGSSTSTQSTALVLSFATSDLAISPNNNFPFGLNTIVSSTLPVADAGQWKHYVLPFTYSCSPGSNENYLFVGMDIQKSIILNNNQPFSEEIFIDDISINLASTISFSLPSPICQGSIISNLAQYASGIGNIVFSGPGVQQAGSLWNINTTGLSPGQYNYNYILTNTTTNCSYTTGAQINVIANPTVNIIGAPGFSCMSNAMNQTTLTANSTPPNISYLWLPGSSTGSSIVISPSINTTYTLIGTAGFCSNIATSNIIVGIQPTIALQKPLSFCLGDHYACLENLLTSTSPTGGVWTSPGLSVSVSGGSAPCTTVSVPINTTPGQYPIIYNYSVGSCNYSANITVPVNLTPSLTTNLPGTYCVNIPTLSVILNAQITPSAATSNYTWLPSGATSPSISVSPTATTIYTVVASNGTCATNPATIQVVSSNSCCTANNYINTSSLSTGVYSGGNAINQNVTVTGTVTLQGDFRIAPNVSITVMPGSVLQTSSNAGAHLSACSAMWSGINVWGQGKVKFGPGDLIEDAITAISASNSNNNVGGRDIDVFRTTFNRNLVSIAIKNYTVGINFNPYRIANCFFTCRDFSLSPGQSTWPSSIGAGSYNLPGYSSTISPYSSPFYFNNFTPCNLKAPYTNTFSNAGVSIENSGLSVNLNQVNSTYYSLDIGEVPTSNFIYYGVNIFDNLYYGIYAKNSNVNSINNVFQNSRVNLTSNNQSQFFVGAGIYDFCDYFNGTYNTQLNLLASTTPSLYCNTFYNCHTSILTQAILDLNIQYAKFYSNANKNALPAAPNIYPGYGGVYFSTNRIKNYRISNNAFYNISNCINGGLSAGNTNLCPTGYGVAFGTCDIFNNNMSNYINFILSNGNQFISEAIRLNAILAPKSSITTLLPNNGVRIQNNNIQRVWRGISVLSFNNPAFSKTSGSNFVLLDADMNPSNPQFGIKHENDTWSAVNNNTVIGFGTNTVLSVSGIVNNLNTTASVQQNTVMNLPRGFDFGGANQTMLWSCNTMSACARGMQLSNTGTVISAANGIGAQGNLSGPKDNRWLGSFTGSSNLHTWTDKYSTAAGSKLWMRNVTSTNNGVVSSYTASNNTGSITNNSYFNNLYRGLSSPTAPNYCGMANRPIVPGECVDCDFNQIYQTAIDTNVDVESIEISRFLLYLTLDTDSILASMNDTLSGFYKANMPESVGKLADIEKTLGLGDFENAGSLMSNFEPQSNIENNFKTFYQLYYNYKTNENSLNEADMYALAILAAQCPFTDGFVVYKARLLNDVIINSITLYNDDECAGQGYSERTTIINNDTINQNKIEINFRDNLKSNEAKKINKINLKTEYTLYPNPTKDVIYIKGINQSEQIQIIIKDVWGRELVNKKIIVEASNTGLQFDLISGIYFVNLINEKGVINVKKLVIYK